MVRARANSPWAAVRWVLGTMGAMVLSTVVLVGAYGVVAASGLTALEDVEVRGARHLGRMDVLKLAGLDSTTQLVSLRVGQVRRRLEAAGWIKQARVERLWPHGLRITIVERTPVALGVVDGRLWYLDRSLAPFAPAPSAAPAMVVISGLGRDELVEPDEEVKQLLKAAGEVLALADEQGRIKGIGKISELHLDRVWGLSMVVEGLEPIICLGMGAIEQKIKAVRRVLGDLARRGELGRARLVDAGARGRIVVRLVREGA